MAEIAQRRLGTEARAQVDALLGPGHSLASEGSWADDVRPSRPETFNWHFVDIPVRESYDPAAHCKASPVGDCIIAELERLRAALPCGDIADRREALRFAVHFVGDIHTAWNWGAYVVRLENGWLASDEARGAAAGGPREWAEEAHAVARAVWPLLPEDHVVTNDYYDKAVPLVDRQLGRAGLRLARFLDQAFAPRVCPAR